jgi:hypothetical protein
MVYISVSIIGLHTVNEKTAGRGEEKKVFTISYSNASNASNALSFSSFFEGCYCLWLYWQQERLNKEPIQNFITLGHPLYINNQKLEKEIIGKEEYECYDVERR